MEHDITLSTPLPRPHLEACAHLSSLHAYFDEVIFLLDKLVGALDDLAYEFMAYFDLLLLGSTTTHVLLVMFSRNLYLPKSPRQVDTELA
jgi:hypothetical protein